MSANTPNTNIAQSQPVQASSDSTSRITTDGNIVSSSDPSTHPDASLTQKLKGNVTGAIKGSVGSVQGATGAMLRNKEMEQAGMEKMQAEDERLGAKRGVMPAGSERRMGTESAT